MRLDGKGTDFSYPRCIKGNKPTVDEYFYRACRIAVSPYLTEAKNELFTKGEVVRASSGEVVTIDTSEYRHTELPFKTLVEEFRHSREMEISLNLFGVDRDMQYNVRFLDASIAEDFIAYHKAHANLALFRKD
jgi:hypothetical protein